MNNNNDKVNSSLVSEKSYKELFEELVKTNLPETIIKKNLGNLNKEQKNDTVELIPSNDQKQEINSCNDLNNKNLSGENKLPYEKKVQLDCLECLEKNKELTS